jgi:hypothetical protein
MPLDGGDPFGPSNGDLSDSPADFGFGTEPAPEPAPMYAAPAPAPAPMSFADEDPFGSSGVDLSGASDEHSAAAAGHYEAPAPMAAAPGLEEFGPSFGDPMPQEQAAPGYPDAGFAAPAPMEYGMVGEDPMAAPAGMEDPFAAPPADPGMSDPFSASAENAAGMSDPFAAQAQAGGSPDPFATAEHSFAATETGRHMIGSPEESQGFLTQTDTSHQVISATETGRHMLDLPSRPGAEPGPEDDFSGQGSRELIDLPSQPEASAPAARPVPSLASAAIARPAGRPADMGIPERRKPSAAQQVTGQVAYLTIAAGLLLAITAVGGVYLKEGRVDASALSPAHLMTLLAPSPLLARDVTNGLYDTRGGSSIFYVRGEVENRASKPMRVKVQAALYDGDQRVKSVEGLAGIVPTPEDLYALTSAEASAQLRSRLDAGATLIAPGGKAPFTLVLQEYPQELSAFRLQVTLEPAPEEGSKP